MALAMFDAATIIWAGEVATWGGIPVVPPPTSIEDQFTYLQRKSQVMPAPTLDSRGLPT